MNRKIGNLHLQKLSRRHWLRTSILLSNYAIKSLFKSRHAIDSCFHYLSLENIISKQWLLIKSSIVDTNNHLNGIFPLFNSLNSKFSPGSRLIDIFSSHFSFHQADYKNKESKAAHLHKLDDIILNASSRANTVIVVSDTSIRNNVATFITYVHSYSNPIKKTLHHAVIVTTAEAELFTIRCGINQAIQVMNVSHIIIITDTIHSAQHIFDSSVHPYQQQFIAILKDLGFFFQKTFI